MYQVTDKSTQHGLKTPHGFNTPHRYPVVTSTNEDLVTLASSLYPTGSAWYMPEGSYLDRLHRGINVSFLRLINYVFGMLDSSFPDNDNFSEADADLWEYRYGITTNPNLTIQQRRAILLRKMSFPQNIKARQGYRYIQDQLNQSGFNVGVYENIFYDTAGNHYYKTPADILATQASTVQHGGATQHGGGTQHGSGNYDVIANSGQKEDFNIGGKLWATFFIAGNTITDTAIIDASREREFRELVLKLKPAHLVAYIFVAYK